MKKPLIVLTGPHCSWKKPGCLFLWQKPLAARSYLQIPCRFINIWILALRRSCQKKCREFPHYLVDELMPEEEFHIVRFQQMAKDAMEKIYTRGTYSHSGGGNRLLYSGGDQRH